MDVPNQLCGARRSGSPKYAMNLVKWLKYNGEAAVKAKEAGGDGKQFYLV